MRKLLLIVAAALTALFCLTGCKKRSDGNESGQTNKTAEYEAKAKEQINAENMDAELEKIEKALEQEMSQGQ